ncbi:MAG: hypothetical protein ACOH1I_11005 [Gallionellaceae bacterium]|jgi:hypothetical protein
MPIPWLVVLQSVPWTDVIRNAPKVAEGAKKLWGTVKGKSSSDVNNADSTDQSSLVDPNSLEGLNLRVRTMEIAITELHEQMLASSELIKTLAEQNTQLVGHIEVNSRRLTWLSLITVILGIVALASLYMAIAH